MNVDDQVIKIANDGKNLNNEVISNNKNIDNEVIIASKPKADEKVESKPTHTPEGNSEQKPKYSEVTIALSTETLASVLFKSNKKADRCDDFWESTIDDFDDPIEDRFVKRVISQDTNKIRKTDLARY